MGGSYGPGVTPGHNDNIPSPEIDFLAAVQPRPSLMKILAKKVLMEVEMFTLRSTIFGCARSKSIEISRMELMGIPSRSFSIRTFLSATMPSSSISRALLDGVRKIVYVSKAGIYIYPRKCIYSRKCKIYLA